MGSSSEVPTQGHFQRKGNFYCAALKPEIRGNFRAEDSREVWKAAFEVFALV